jgi:hypothetical protein
MTIGEVSTRCGFRSLSYFSSTFTAHFGQRPSDVRRLAHDYRTSTLPDRIAWGGAAPPATGRATGIDLDNPGRPARTPAEYS